MHQIVYLEGGLELAFFIYLEGGLELAFFKTVHSNRQIAYLEGGLELAFFKTVHSNQSDNSVQHAAVLQGLKKFYLAKRRSFRITLKSKNYNAKK